LAIAVAVQGKACFSS